MSDNTFIDTNILIYSFSNKDLAKQKNAQKIINSEKVYISIQVTGIY